VRAAIIGTQRAVVVGIICAFIGIIVGPVVLTGLGLNLASGFVSLAGGSLILLLIMTMAASLILGSGLPSTATYIFLAVLMVPSVVEFGIPVLAAHLFVMYFGILSDLSPPTMATVFVASAIADSKPIRSAMYAMGFGIAGFIVPFMFVTRPEMLFLEGQWWNSALAAVGCAVVLVLLIDAATGYHYGPLSGPVRLMLLACGVVGAIPYISIATSAVVVGIIVLAWHFYSLSRRQTDSASVGGVVTTEAPT
jgi:TRAP-type uncharacterized transport system fused permease subunit